MFILMESSQNEWRIFWHFYSKFPVRQTKKKRALFYYSTYSEADDLLKWAYIELSEYAPRTRQLQ